MSAYGHISVYVVDYNRKYLLLQWCDPTTGKRMSKSSKCTTRRQAERAAKDLEDRLNALIPRGDGLVSWTDFVMTFGTDYLLSVGESTSARFHGVMNVFERTMQPKNLRMINARLLSEYAAKLREMNRSESTIGTHINHLRVMLRWAYDNGFIDDLPKFPSPARGSRTKAKGRPITLKELAAILRGIRPVMLEQISYLGNKIPSEINSHIRKWRKLIIGLWLSGLRLGEALELKWHEGPLWIDTTGNRWLLGISDNSEKGKQNRLLPLTPDFVRWLSRIPDEKRTGFVFEIAKGKDFAFRRVQYVSRTISACGKKSGVKVSSTGKFASAHDLRRSFGLRWATRVSGPELQQMMRHSSIETTMKYYAIIDAQAFADKLWANHSTHDTTDDRNR